MKHTSYLMIVLLAGMWLSAVPAMAQQANTARIPQAPTYVSNPINSKAQNRSSNPRYAPPRYVYSGRVQPKQSQSGYVQPSYSHSGYSQSQGTLNIVPPHVNITQSLVMPTSGGYVHSMQCPGLYQGRSRSYMYAEDAIQRGIRPNGECPQCHARLQQRTASVYDENMARQQELKAKAEQARLQVEENNRRYRVEKQMKEIEDNRRWDNHMAEWKYNQPAYNSRNEYVGSTYNNNTRTDWYQYNDGGRSADAEKLRTVINGNNNAAKAQTDAVLKVNGYK